ncbi:MAG: prepilin peptidase [Lachnospiraceae bacterium]|nr:prepilin peptidase [Lachnospiraceae bacterium]
MFGTAGVISILGIGSYFDIRWKRIPTALLGAGTIWAILCVILQVLQKGAGEAMMAAFLSVLPGVGLLLLSLLTEKKVGSGDGLILILLGLFEGVERAVPVFCLGLFLQSLLAVGLLIFKKADKQTCIPFLPFLLISRLLILFLTSGVGNYMVFI